MALLEPKEVEFDLPGGGTKTYILSKFPAVAGREIITQYPLSGLPKIGDYAVNEQIMFKLMGYVAVPAEHGEPIRLTTAALVNNHISSWEVLARIEVAMIEYNTSFFLNGSASTFLNALAQRIPEWISKIVMASSAASLRQEKPLSTN